MNLIYKTMLMKTFGDFNNFTYLLKHAYHYKINEKLKRSKPKCKININD